MKWLFWPALGNECGNCSPKLKDTYTVTISGIPEPDTLSATNGTWTVTQTGTPPGGCIWTYDIDANFDVILFYSSGKWIVRGRYVEFFYNEFQLTTDECNTPIGSYTTIPGDVGTCVVSA